MRNITVIITPKREIKIAIIKDHSERTERRIVSHQEVHTEVSNPGIFLLHIIGNTENRSNGSKGRRYKLTVPDWFVIVGQIHHLRRLSGQCLAGQRAPQTQIALCPTGTRHFQQHPVKQSKPLKASTFSTTKFRPTIFFFLFFFCFFLVLLFCLRIPFWVLFGEAYGIKNEPSPSFCSVCVCLFYRKEEREKRKRYFGREVGQSEILL